MLKQGGHGAEGGPALQALVVLNACVHQVVLCQVGAVAEGMAAVLHT